MNNTKKRKHHDDDGGGGGDANNSAGGGDGHQECPYLDTIQRSLLDFDLEPACCVTLEKGPHIYGCLVCGKFFRGRGPRTPAYTHSVEESHFVFIHLTNATFHCLPDGYQIRDPSLQDIAAALRPTFTEQQIADLDRGVLPDGTGTGAGTTADLMSRDLFGRRYLPGFIGLNNLNKTDGINSVVQALAHVPPLRNYFLRNLDPNRRHHNGNSSSSQKKNKKSGDGKKSAADSNKGAVLVTEAFGELVRKLWSNQRFKSHIDPHIFVHAVATASKRKFQLGVQVEAGELMAWLLHQLHVGTGGSLKKSGSSIVHSVFQGEVRVTTRAAVRKRNANDSKEDEDDRAGSDVEDTEDVAMKDRADADDVGTGSEGFVVEETTVDTHFLQLTLDIPEKPLFRDEDGGLVIPQEPFPSVLQKFDGVTFSEAISKSSVSSQQMRRYQLRKLPNYLILHLSRFKSNKYRREKNPTIVTFPVKNLDLSNYVNREEDGEDDNDDAGESTNGHKKRESSAPPSEDEIRGMSVKELKRLLRKHGRLDVAESIVEKDELVSATIDFVRTSLPDLLSQKYDLVANITHVSPGDVGREEKVDPLQAGSYKAHVQHVGTRQWYELQDLHVQEIMPQQIGLSESFLLIFERKKSTAAK